MLWANTFLVVKFLIILYTCSCRYLLFKNHNSYKIYYILIKSKKLFYSIKMSFFPSKMHCKILIWLLRCRINNISDSITVTNCTPPFHIDPLTCSILSGSFRVTGMEILVRSFPMFLYRMFHKLMSPESGLGTGSLDRRPVSNDTDSWSSDTGREKPKT